MDFLEEKITTLFGSLGGVTAYFLNINVVHVFEIAFYVFIGAAVGECVKEGVKWYKRKRASND